MNKRDWIAKDERGKQKELMNSTIWEVNQRAKG